MSREARIKARIERIDFIWVERHLGYQIPIEIINAFYNPDFYELENRIVDGDGVYFCLNSWEPQNMERYSNVWPGTEGRLILADDGSGNEFHMLPKEGFRYVHFFDHETGDTKNLSIGFSDLVKKLREVNVDD